MIAYQAAGHGTVSLRFGRKHTRVLTKHAGHQVRRTCVYRLVEGPAACVVSEFTFDLA